MYTSMGPYNIGQPRCYYYICEVFFSISVNLGNWILDISRYRMFAKCLKTIFLYIDKTFSGINDVKMFY